jgi:hypothetical protein
MRPPHIVKHIRKFHGNVKNAFADFTIRNLKILFFSVQTMFSLFSGIPHCKKHMKFSRNCEKCKKKLKKEGMTSFNCCVWND